MTRTFLALAALSIFTSATQAQAPRQQIVLAPASVLDGTSTVAHRNWVVVVSGNSITYAGPNRADAAAANARRIELPGLTLMPGLIDAHVHFFLHPYNEAQWDDQVLKESVALRIARATVHARNTLMAGFTTVRDLGTEGAGYADAGLREAIATGIIPGPRLLISSKAIVATGAYAPLRTAYAYSTPLGAEEADETTLPRVIRDQIGHGADWIKLYGDFNWGPDGSGRPTFSPDEMRLAGSTARDAGRELVVHASTGEGIRRAVLAGAKTIEHGDEGTPEAFKLMARQRVAYCPTLAATEANHLYRGWKKGTDPVPTAVARKKKAFADALAAGVIICTGSDAGVFTHGDNVRELELMREYGMKSADVLKSATSVTAKALGMDQVVGRIASGLRADIIAVAGDPVVDVSALRNIRFVMKDGIVFRDEARATR